MSWRIVSAVGVELEGGWDEMPRDHSRLKADGSVRVQADEYVGELASPILRSEDSVSDFIHNNHPHRVDASCGLHVHMSFLNSVESTMNVVGILGDKKSFQTYLLRRIKAWARSARVADNHPLWGRLLGRNEFCKRDWDPELAFIRPDRPSRYRICNFNAAHRHKTIEIRVLPMFPDAATSLAAVLCVVDAAEKYLARHLKGWETEKLVMDDSYGSDAKPISVVGYIPDYQAIIADGEVAIEAMEDNN